MTQDSTNQPNLPSFDLNTLRQEAEERVSIINQEFKKGFDFLTNHPASVTFFGSARTNEDEPFYQKAQELAGRIVKETGFSIITGGGPGIMEAANRGAYEAGGRSVGFCIDLPQEQQTNPYVKETLDFHYFFSRKVCLSFSAEAFVYFPGGFGTLDEFFEVITLVQTNKIHQIPIFLFGEDYWRPLDTYFKEELVKRKTISEEDTELYTITEDLDHIVKTIKEDARVIAGVRRRKEI
ncbi:MAG: TIGR00730 family Rossman fold protein [Candidatus Paceibacterota bacterium]